VFLDTLGRAIDSNGVQFYVTAIRSGLRRPDVVQSILSSQEYRAEAVRADFVAILRRQPTGDEVNLYLGQLNQGLTDEQVKAELFGSGEYFTNRGGGTNAGFLAALYPDVLDRPLDDSGAAGWGGQLAAGASRQDVAQGVLSSGEAFQVLVKAAYPKFLRRTADAGGLTFWGGQLTQGMTDEQFYAGLLGSLEYYVRYSA
jgi:hypothetical protein